MENNIRNQMKLEEILEFKVQYLKKKKNHWRKLNNKFELT
jgi:hypothetical protein